MEVFPGLTVDPQIRFGKPCLTGTRIDVATVIGALAAGDGFEAIQEAFALTYAQVLDALRYSAHIVEHLPPVATTSLGVPIVSTVEAIERAIEQLPSTELGELRRWFAQFDADTWDAQIETDAAAGRLDALAADALAEHRRRENRD